MKFILYNPIVKPKTDFIKGPLYLALRAAWDLDKGVNKLGFHCFMVKNLKISPFVLH